MGTAAAAAWMRVPYFFQFLKKKKYTQKRSISVRVILKVICVYVPSCFCSGVVLYSESQTCSHYYWSVSRSLRHTAYLVHQRQSLMHTTSGEHMPALNA